MRRRRDQGHAGNCVTQLGNVHADLVTGKLPPLTRLGTLGHLDFDFLRARQIGGTDAEAPGSDLFDGAVGPVAIFETLESAGILATLSTVRLAANAVHRNGQCLVSLGTKSTKRHSSRGETAADFLDGFNLIKRHGTGRKRHKFQEIPQGVRCRRHDGIDIFFIILGLARLFGSLDADKGVEILNDRRRDGVQFASAADAVISRVFQFATVDRNCRTVGQIVTEKALPGDFFESNSFNLGRGAGETLFDQFGGDAGGFKSLRSTVATNNGDTHLGHDLEQAALERLLVVELRGGEINLDRTLLNHLTDGLDR